MHLLKAEFENPDGYFVDGLDDFKFDPQSDLYTYHVVNGEPVLKEMKPFEHLLESGITDGTELSYAACGVKSLGVLKKPIIITRPTKRDYKILDNLQEFRSFKVSLREPCVDFKSHHMP